MVEVTFADCDITKADHAALRRLDSLRAATAANVYLPVDLLCRFWLHEASKHNLGAAVIHLLD